MRSKKGLVSEVIVRGIIVLVLMFLAFSVIAKGPVWLKGIFGINVTGEGLAKYTPEDESAVISMKALTCAINSQVLGEPAWIKEDYKCGTYCDCSYTKAKEATPTPTGAVILDAFNSVKNKITGFAAKDSSCSGIYYENNICVECSGFDTSFLKLKPNKQEAIKQIGEATIECWEALSVRKSSDEYTNCFMLDPSQLPAGVTIRDSDIRKWLNKQAQSGKVLTGNNIVFVDKFEMDTWWDIQWNNRNKWGGHCIYYQVDGGHNSLGGEISGIYAAYYDPNDIRIEYCNEADASATDYEVIKLIDDKDKALEQIFEAMMWCYTKYDDKSKRRGEYTKCAKIDVSGVNPDAHKFEIKEGHIDTYLRDKAGMRGKFLGGYDYKNDNRLAMQPISKKTDTACIYYDIDTYTDDINIGKCQNLYTSPFECRVKGFELPQDIEKDNSLFSLNWIAGNNDPKYVAYFESFPRDKTKYWHVDGISILNVGMMAGFAVFDLIPVFGKAVKGGAKAVVKVMKKGAKETAEQISQSGSKNIIKEFFKGFAKKGWKRTLRQTAIKESFQESFYGVGEITATKAATKIDDVLKGMGFFKRIRMKLSEGYREKLLQKMSKELAEGADAPLSKIHISPDFFAEYVAKTGMSPAEAMKPAAKAYREKVAREMGEESLETYTTKLTKEVVDELTQKLAVKNFFRQMTEEGLEEGAERLSKKNVQEAIGKSLNQIRAMSKSQRAKAAEKGAELSEQLMNKEGLFDFAKLVGSSVKDPKEFNKKFTKNLIEYVDYAEGDSLAKMMVGAGFKGLKKGSVGSHNPLKNPIKFFGDQLPLALRKPKFSANPLKWLPVETKMVQWIKDHKYPIIAALAYYGASMDAADEKYDPVGTTALGLDQPFMEGKDEGKVRSFKLIDNASSYFITPKLYKDKRFYLASPCKADLVIRTSPSECTRQVMDQHYMFPDNTQTMDVENVEINHELLANDEEVYNWALRNNDELRKLMDDSDEEVIKYLQWKLRKMHKPGLKDVPTIKKYKNPGEIVQKYKDLYSITSTDNVKNVTALIIFYSRTEILNFFENTINGWAISEIEVPFKHIEKYSYFYDVDNIIKKCNVRDITTKVIDNVIYVWRTTQPGEIKIENDIYHKYTFNVPGITVDINRYEDWNDGVNYCIDEYPHLNIVRGVLVGFEIAISAIATVFTGGLATPLIIASAGIGAGIVEEWVARKAKWPSHHTQGTSVPIAQKGLGGAEWTLTGDTSE